MEEEEQTDRRRRGFTERSDGRLAAVWAVGSVLTVHIDLLAQLDQLHLRGHVAHRPHAVAQVLAADETVLVLVELFEGVPQLCGANEVLAHRVKQVA